MTRLFVAAAFLCLAVPAQAQDDHGFRFVRIQFENRASGWGGRANDPWKHDHPVAEYNFYEALERTTLVHVDGPPLVLALDDDRIFSYPLLYLCEPGYWVPDDDEVARLRAYLDRGGFILFDDFRGADEWENLVEQMRRVYPDRALAEIPPEHPIWSIYYDVDPVAAPSLIRAGRFGGGYEDRYVALFDDAGRMVALACVNQDLGDGWEWPEFSEQDASLVTFQMGVNFLMYALTH